ncbi:GAF domain-containing SpoIIE family protein phosphatase [Streptosporangium sp. NPDC048865]|uniref:PP2C family protein-serine/threonine phosphatase n=1 Tax=Streptosporangium sp. NPDC048865 TaxID=3155766 RepID=UPI00342DF2C3
MPEQGVAPVHNGHRLKTISDLPREVFDEARVAAVRATRLLDGEPEAVFDDLAELAAASAGVERAFVTLVDDRRSFWLSAVGMGTLGAGERQNAVYESPCHILVATGEPLVVSDARNDPRMRDLAAVDKLGIGAWAGYPVHGPGGEVLGGLCVVDSRARSWSERQLKTLDTLARAVTTEIRLRHALVTAERQVRELESSWLASTALARTLQQSLLPPVLARVPGIETAALYLSASGGAEVTGDFYDLFPVSGSRWSVVLGDVCGKGVEAATVTALARYTLRADAPRHVSPSRMLGQLNDALRAQQVPVGRFLTAVCAIFRPEGDRFVGLLCTAGHPPVLLRRADGTVHELFGAGAALGIFDDIQLHNVHFELDPGDVLLFYTDGVTEARQRGGVDFFGEENLARLLAGCADLSAQQIITRVRDAVLAHTGDEASDDTALLALRVPPRPR